MSKIQSALLYACVALLAACGGGNSQGDTAASPAQATLGGTLTGLPDGGTLLVSNGNLDSIAISANGNFAFDKKIPVGTDYKVAVMAPSGLNCSVANGAGTVPANANAIGNVAITCTPGAVAFINFYVGVTVSGLAQGNSVTFTNNGSDTLTVSDNGLFMFPQAYVEEGVYAGRAGGYAVAVQTNPKGQTCSLTNATGALPGSQTSYFVNVLAACK